jgi:serine/threonine protein kinase
VWEEDRKNIKLEELIGSGNYGEVYKALWRDRFAVAVKTLKFSDQGRRSSRREEASKQEFRKELEIMKKLRHEKLVKLWCVCTIGEPVYIVTEYMCNGSLLTYLREGDGYTLNFKEIIDMSEQIASGMKYLEASRCVHRDLAARNILVGERKIVKIADFGFAQMLNSTSDEVVLLASDSNKFPVKWTAPEVFSVDPVTGSRLYTIKSDVWSFGILLYELITLGANPYAGMAHPQVIYEVKENGYRMPKPPGMCTDEFYAIMLKCWHEDANQRPTFEWLFAFFNDFYVSTQPSYAQ